VADSERGAGRHSGKAVMVMGSTPRCPVPQILERVIHSVYPEFA